MAARGSGSRPARRLRGPAAAWRAAVTACACAALIATTAVGNADHFPFAPFTQFAGSVDPDRPFRALFLVGHDVRGRSLRIFFTDTGLRRAEVENQINRLGRSPERLLPHLAVAYRRLNPDRPPLVSLVLNERVYDVSGARVRRVVDRPVAEWTR